MSLGESHTHNFFSIVISKGQAKQHLTAPQARSGAHNKTRDQHEDSNDVTSTDKTSAVHNTAQHTTLHDTHVLNSDTGIPHLPQRSGRWSVMTLKAVLEAVTVSVRSPQHYGKLQNVRKIVTCYSLSKKSLGWFHLEPRIFHRNNTNKKMWNLPTMARIWWEEDATTEWAEGPPER